MTSTLIRPVYDEDAWQAITDVTGALEQAYEAQADAQMKAVAEVQVEFVLRNIRTPDSLYDPCSGHGYMSTRVKNLTYTIANWLKFDYRGPVVDDGFLRRIRYLYRLAEMEPLSQAS